MNLISIIQNNHLLLGFIVIWSLTWKAVALWHAARNNQFAWYIALIVINTIGILEIIYILFFRRRIGQSSFTHTPGWRL